MSEIKLDFLIKIFKKTFWKILIISVIVMILAAAFTHFCIAKTYSSSIKFYVVNINADYDYTSSSLVTAAPYLVNDYIAIIKSDRMLDKVVDQLHKEGYHEITKKQVNNMISSSSANQTSVFSLSISSTDPELAFKVASIIAEMAPATVTSVAKSSDNSTQALSEKILFVIHQLDPTTKDTVSKEHVQSVMSAAGIASDQSNCIELLTPPVKPTSHDSPNLVLYTLVAGILAACASYALFLLYEVLNQTIVTEEDVRQYINYPVIGVIPHWESDGKN